MNLPALDNARRRCIDSLRGAWTRAEIEAAIEAIADDAVARSLVHPDVVSDWILDRRTREAREAHERAARKVSPGAAVVAIGRPRGAA